MIMMIMTTMMIINVVETYSQDLQGRRPRPFVEWALKSLPCEPCGIWGWTVSQSLAGEDIHLHVGEGKDWGKGPQSGGPAGGNLDKASMIMSMMILMIMVIMMIVM